LCDLRAARDRKECHRGKQTEGCEKLVHHFFSFLNWFESIEFSSRSCSIKSKTRWLAIVENTQLFNYEVLSFSFPKTSPPPKLQSALGIESQLGQNKATLSSPSTTSRNQ
jgi:hypothetical protein